MKKIFTLIAMATMAVGVNAQEVEPDIWDANSDDAQAVITTSKANPQSIVNDNFFSIPKNVLIYPEGTWDPNANPSAPTVTKIDGAVAPDLKLYEFTIDKTYVTLHAVSTPNSDATVDEAWQMAGGGNKGLNTKDCPVQFEKFVKPKNGNPSISYKEFYEETSNGESFRVSEDYWTPESNTMPGKGNYYEFTAKAAGTLMVALRINRPSDAFYVFNKATFAQLPPSDLSIDGYVNNNGVIWGTNTEAFSNIKMNEQHTYQQDGIPGKEIFGYLTIEAAENTTYVMLCPKGQIGLFGFYFQPTSGIANVKTIAQKSNAPIYNLAGQKVAKDFKGIVIQNGKKFVVK
jgi:hypothetical protein